MIEGPLGGAAFNNEFGRPNLGGYFRVYEQTEAAGVAPRLPQADHDRRRPGRHPPRPDAQGALPAGHAADPARRAGHAHRHGRRRRQLDGGRREQRRPGLRLGAARQSRDPAPRAGSHQPLLGAGRGQPDPGDPRRRCRRHLQRLPGTGRRAGRGARFDLRAVPLEESGLAPKEIWCNESQERYVLAIAPDALPVFAAMCERERCPFAVVGVATADGRAGARGRPGRRRAIDMPMDVLLGKPPRMHRDVARVRRARAALDLAGVALEQASHDVLRHPTVAEQAVPGHDRRPQRRRPEPPRPDGGTLAGAGGGLARSRWPTSPASPARR